MKKTTPTFPRCSKELELHWRQFFSLAGFLIADWLASTVLLAVSRAQHFVEERTMCLWTPFGCQVQKKLWNHNFPSLSLSLASAHSKLEDVKTRNFDSKGNQLGRVHHPNQSQYLPTNTQKNRERRFT